MKSVAVTCVLLCCVTLFGIDASANAALRRGALATAPMNPCWWIMEAIADGYTTAAKSRRHALHTGWHLSANREPGSANGLRCHLLSKKMRQQHDHSENAP
jgi:hypothetical protein